MDKYLDLDGKQKNLWIMKMTVILTVVEALGTAPNKPGKETLGTEDQRENRDYPDHSTIKISSDTLRSPEDLRRLAVTQTSAKTHT